MFPALDTPRQHSREANINSLSIDTHSSQECYSPRSGQKSPVGPGGSIRAALSPASRVKRKAYINPKEIRGPHSDGQGPNMASFNFGFLYQGAQLCGARRPCYNTQPTEALIRMWTTFMQQQQVQRVLCLLDEREIEEHYTSFGHHLMDHYKAEFGQDKVFHVPLDNQTCPSMEQMENVFAALDAAHDAKEIILVHCSTGMGRTGLVMAAWLLCRLTTQYPTVDEAVAAVHIAASKQGCLRSPFESGGDRVRKLLREFLQVVAKTNEQESREYGEQQRRLLAIESKKRQQAAAAAEARRAREEAIEAAERDRAFTQLNGFLRRARFAPLSQATVAADNERQRLIVELQSSATARNPQKSLALLNALQHNITTTLEKAAADSVAGLQFASGAHRASVRQYHDHLLSMIQENRLELNDWLELARLREQLSLTPDQHNQIVGIMGLTKDFARGLRITAGAARAQAQEKEPQSQIPSLDPKLLPAFIVEAALCFAPKAPQESASSASPLHIDFTPDDVDNWSAKMSPQAPKSPTFTQFRRALGVGAAAALSPRARARKEADSKHRQKGAEENAAEQRQTFPEAEGIDAEAVSRAQRLAVPTAMQACIGPCSSAHEVRAWLLANHFDAASIQSLKDFTGYDLLRISHDEVKELLGTREAMRLFMKPAPLGRDADPSAVRQWLLSNNFEISSKDVPLQYRAPDAEPGVPLSAADILRLTKAEAKECFGAAVGIRLFNRLHP